MRPKCDPRGAKIEDKNEIEKRKFRRSSWSRLGAILARLGGRLGVIFIDFVLVFILFREKRRFEKLRCREATWADLGPIWGAKRVQN